MDVTVRTGWFSYGRLNGSYNLRPARKITHTPPGTTSGTLSSLLRQENHTQPKIVVLGNNISSGPFRKRTSRTCEAWRGVFSPLSRMSALEIRPARVCVILRVTRSSMSLAPPHVLREGIIKGASKPPVGVYFRITWW